MSKKVDERLSNEEEFTKQAMDLPSGVRRPSIGDGEKMSLNPPPRKQRK
jgi:hypothetical protein